VPAAIAADLRANGRLPVAGYSADVATVLGPDVLRAGRGGTGPSQPFRVADSASVVVRPRVFRAQVGAASAHLAQAPLRSRSSASARIAAPSVSLRRSFTYARCVLYGSACGGDGGLASS